MAFSFVRRWSGREEYISSNCRCWTTSESQIGSWSSASEAITALATRFSRSRNKSNSNWKKEDILKWMIDENTELEFTGASE